MAYGIKYQFTFNTVFSNEVITCDILQKNYVGSITTVTGFSRSPVVVEYDSNDTVLSPINGASATINIIGNASFNADTFYSEDDTEYQVKIYRGINVYFIGFLVPEETSMPILFGDYPFTLTFTDQIGLLRNRKFSETEISINDLIDLPLSQAIGYCLRLTGLELELAIYCNTWPNGSDTAQGTWANDVSVIKYFGKDGNNEFKDCLQVLEQIVGSMNAKLFQANGRWNVVCVTQWSDFQTNTVNGIDGGILSYNFSVNTINVLSNIVTDLLAINRSQLKTVIRPVETVINTFNYNAPVQIENIDLNKLGSFISSSTLGDITKSDYNLIGWSNQNSQAAVIRVEFDNVKKVEIERYIYSPHRANDPVGSLPDALVSNLFLVEFGDKAFFAFRYGATSDSNSFDRFKMAFYLDDLATTNMRSLTQLPNSNPQLIRLNWNARFAPYSLTNIPFALSIQRPNTEDATQYSFFQYLDLDISEKGQPKFPYDATARIAIQAFNNNNSEVDLNAKIKGFTFEYQFWINETDETIGQKHTINNTTAIVKKRTEREVFLDDSPRFLSKGTMYRIVSGAKVKTTTWSKLRSSTAANFTKRWGQILQENEILLSGINRERLEGTFKGIISYSDLCNFTFDTGKYFIPSRVAIDLKNEQVNGSFFEVANDVTAATNEYEFLFIYKIKEK